VEGRPLDERELVTRAQRGDVRAYEELVRLYSEIAYRTAYLVLGSADDAEDTCQEAFLKAHAALGRFRTDAPFRPWLLQIVANEARNRRRSAGRRLRLLTLAAADARLGDAAPSPESVALAADDRRRLLEAVNELGEDDRLVIGCRYFLELSGDETAAALGVAEGTVKSRLSRALDRLRERMAAHA
jgi:RNA polymerase sigma-70 factor (ECF subfamily)